MQVPRLGLILILFFVIAILCSEAAITNRKGRKQSQRAEGGWGSWSPVEKCPLLGSPKGCTCLCRFRHCQKERLCLGHRMEVSNCTCSSSLQSSSPEPVKGRKCRGHGRSSGCIRPPLPPNVVITPSTQKSSAIYRRGNKLKFSCKDHSLILSLDTMVTCLPNGTWSGQLPTCIQPTSCRPPPLPPKMFIKPRHQTEHYQKGDFLDVHCDVGFALSKMASVRCSDNGVWSGEMPACIKTGWPLTAINVPLGKTVVNISIPCKVSNANLFRSEIWFCHKDTVFPHKYYMKDPLTNEVRLSLPNFGEGNQGFYTCFCEFRNGTLVSHTTLVETLQKLPDFTFRTKSSNQSFFRGGTYILPCSAPSSTITWLKDGHVVYYENSSFRILPDNSLMFYEAETWQTGTYTCIAEHVDRKTQISHSFTVTVQDPIGEICGQPRIIPSKQTSRITQGEDAKKGTHPWMAFIQMPDSTFCGGSLVDAVTILTAAHCLKDARISTINVTLGKYYRKKMDSDERWYGVSRINYPKTYGLLGLYHDDIAAVTLDRTVQFTDYILPICLPYRGFLDGGAGEARPSKVFGKVAGWGRLYANSETNAKHLMEVSLPIQDFGTCNASHPNLVTDSMFCAGEPKGGKDACSGDSGGPFEVVRGDRTYLAGIVSWGDNCSQPMKYGFYTKVEKFINQKNNLMKYVFF